jgi:hypothetical protein
LLRLLQALRDLQHVALRGVRAAAAQRAAPEATMQRQLPPALGGRCLSSEAGNPEGPPAFVFDIDGVLIRGGNVLPAARRALANLYQPGGMLHITPSANEHAYMTFLTSD